MSLEKIREDNGQQNFTMIKKLKPNNECNEAFFTPTRRIT
jgi:hypothetical protein